MQSQVVHAFSFNLDCFRFLLYKIFKCLDYGLVLNGLSSQIKLKLEIEKDLSSVKKKWIMKLALKFE